MDEFDDFDPMADSYHDYTFNSYVGGYENLPSGEPGAGTNFQNEGVLYVTSIPVEIDEYGLRNVFNRAGTVMKILGFHKPKDSNKKMGKVVYATKGEAANAITNIHMKEPYRMNVHLDRYPDKLNWECWVLGQLDTANNGNRRSSPLRETPRNLPFVRTRGGHSAAGRGRSDGGGGGGRGRHYGRGDLKNQRPNYTNNAQSDVQRKATMEQPAPIPPLIFKGNCLRCSLVACYRCTRCNGLYCSHDCQKKDYRVHSITCRTYGTSNEVQSQPINKYKNERPPYQSQLAENRTPQNDSSRGMNAYDSAPPSNMPNQQQQQRYYNKKEPEPQRAPCSNGFAAKSQQGEFGGNSQTSKSFSTTLIQKYSVTESQPKEPDRSTAAVQNGTKMDLGDVPQQPSKPQLFAKGSEAIVEMSHADDPSSFYVFLVNKHDELVDLRQKVNHASSTAAPLAFISPGQIVAAKFSGDNLFYRAVIKRIRNDDFIELFFMDYGNSEAIRREFLRSLPPDLASIPGYAMWCSLANVNSLDDAVGWTTDANRELFRYLGKHLTATCVEIRGLQFGVILYDDKGKDIGELIYAATKLSDKKYGACKASSIPTPLAQRDSPQEVGGGSSSTECSVNTGLLSQWKVGDVIKLGLLSRDGDTALWMMVMSDFDSESVSLISSLSDQCTVPAKRLHAAEGSIVCAFSPADKLWCRAVVKHVGGDGRFTVQYLDYGNVETVSALCNLPEEFKRLAALAVQLEFRDPDTCKKVADGITGDGLNVTVLASEREKAKVRLFLAFEHINVLAFSVWHDKFAASPKVRVAGPTVSVIADHPVPSGDVQVTISHMDASGVVYVTLPNRTSQLDQLQNALKAKYESETIAPLSTMSLPQANQLLCARFSKDNEWYRGRVEPEGIVSGHEVRVRYVDFGNVETLPVNRLKLLMPQFFTPPAFVLHVRPKITVPVPNDQVAALLFGNDTHIWSVKVLDDAVRPVVVQMSMDGHTLDRILAESYVPNAAAPPAHAATAPPAHVAAPPARAAAAATAPPARAAATSPPARASAAAPPARAVVSLCETVQLEVGKPASIMVNEVLSGGVMCGIVVDTKVLVDIDELNVMITERCENEPPPSINDVKWSVGTLLLAKSEEYNQWFRARVIDVIDSTHCRVFFADFGNLELVDVVNLRSIRPEFCLIPLQCVKFILEGVLCNTSLATGMLRKLVLSQNLVANIISFASNKYTVRIPRLDPELIELGLMQA